MNTFWGFRLLLCRWAKKGSERWINLLKVTEPVVHGWTRAEAQLCTLRALGFQQLGRIQCDPAPPPPPRWCPSLSGAGMEGKAYNLSHQLCLGPFPVIILFNLLDAHPRADIFYYFPTSKTTRWEVLGAMWGSQGFRNNIPHPRWLRTTEIMVSCFWGQKSKIKMSAGPRPLGNL